MAQPIDVTPGAATEPTPRRMTYAEFLRSDYVWAEWVDGEVVELSPGGLRHQLVAGHSEILLRKTIGLIRGFEGSRS